MKTMKIFLMAVLVSMAVIAVQGVASAASPVAQFTENASTGVAYVGSPVCIQFTDTSSGTPTSWSWDFGDGTTSTLQNPVHNFYWADNYTVKLTATNGDGSNTVTEVNCINVPLVIKYNGNVIDELYVSDLYSLPLITQDVHYLKHNDPTTYWYNNTVGANLTYLLNNEGVNSVNVAFFGSDNFNTTISYSTIAADSGSVIAFNASPDGSLRNILPSQTYANQWVKDLLEIRIS